MYIINLMVEQNFFAELQERESEFGISDVQMGLTTLEEVFLNIAKQAELMEDPAAGQEKLVSFHLTSGTCIQVGDVISMYVCKYVCMYVCTYVICNMNE
jgi:hypothetical protein